MYESILFVSKHKRLSGLFVPTTSKGEKEKEKEKRGRRIEAIK